MTTDTTTQLTEVFPGNKAASNMPFFDGETLVFCQSDLLGTAMVRSRGRIWKSVGRNTVNGDFPKGLLRTSKITYRPWKLVYCKWNDKIIRPIQTGLPSRFPERSPAIYREDGQVHLSFISGGPTSRGFYYNLLTCSGPDLDHLSKPELVVREPLFFGFVSPFHICWGRMNYVIVKEKAAGATFRLKTSFYRIAAISFVANEPAKLLITGLVDSSFACTTVLYDLATESVSQLCGEIEIYKSSIYGDQVIFAQKKTGKFEDRTLIAGKVGLEPSKVIISKI